MPDLKTVEVWAEYSKDRFESVAKRVDEFRNWARQLGAAVAVVIGLELTLVAKVLELKPSSEPQVQGVCLLLLLVAAGLHFLLLWWLLFIGYRSRKVRQPESPIVLANYVLTRDEQETRRVIGAYYAKAYEHFRDLSKSLGTKVAIATAVFTASMLLLFAGVLLWVRLATQGYNLSGMSEGKSEPSVAPEQPQQPSSVAPQTPPELPSRPADSPVNPLVVTPTEGEFGKFGTPSPPPLRGVKLATEDEG